MKRITAGNRLSARVRRRANGGRRIVWFSHDAGRHDRVRFVDRPSFGKLARVLGAGPERMPIVARFRITTSAADTTAGFQAVRREIARQAMPTTVPPAGEGLHAFAPGPADTAIEMRIADTRCEWRWMTPGSVSRRDLGYEGPSPR